MNTCTSDTWGDVSSQRCRQRLSRMTDEALLKYYESCVYMTTPHAPWVEIGQSYVIQLAITEQEMERRAIINE